MIPSIADRLARARADLRAAGAELANEISHYPTPIAGCDAQFNHLLSMRYQVNAALTALARDVHIPTPRSPS